MSEAAAVPLAAALIRILADQKLRCGTLARRGRERVARHFYLGRYRRAVAGSLEQWIGMNSRSWNECQLSTSRWHLMNLMPLMLPPPWLSILVNAASEDQPSFCVLDNGLLDASRNWRSNLFELYGSKIQFIKPDLARFAACPTKHHARAAYSRLALPDLLARAGSDHLFGFRFDCPPITGPVWASDLKGNAALVVRDAADLFGSHFLEHKQRLGLRIGPASL